MRQPENIYFVILFHLFPSLKLFFLLRERLFPRLLQWKWKSKNNVIHYCLLFYLQIGSEGNKVQSYCYILNCKENNKKQNYPILIEKGHLC